MPFSVLTPATEVIIPAKFYVDSITGFGERAPPKVTFHIFFGTTLRTVLHYRADSDIKHSKMVQSNTHLEMYIFGQLTRKQLLDILKRLILLKSITPYSRLKWTLTFEGFEESSNCQLLIGIIDNE